MTFDQTYHSHTADGEAACGFRQSHFAALGAFAVAVDREFHGRGGRRPTRCCAHVFPFDVSFFMNMALLGFAFVPAAAAVHIEGQVQAGGGPLARSAVTLWAASAGEPKQLAQTRTRADGRFELHANENLPARYLIANGGEPTLNKGSGDNPAIVLLAGPVPVPTRGG